MARSRAHGVPALAVTAVLIAVVVGACSPAGPPASTAASTAVVSPLPTELPTSTPGGPLPSASAIAGMLVTTSTVDPITWYGERCDPLDPEWLVTGETAAEGYTETWTYRAEIDPVTHLGTYEYDAKGEIAGGSLTKKGAGTASVLEADGTAILKVDDISVTGVITAGGTTQTVTLPVPGTEFVFRPAPREDCP